MSGATPLGGDQAQVEKAGGQIVDEILVPQDTRDFTAYLLKVQQIKPDVVAAAVGGDDIKALRQQVAELKLEDKPAWINNQQDWPDVWGVPETLFGVFGTTWYHKLTCPASPSSSSAGRRPTRSRRSRCRATSPTTATWRRASCCAPSSSTGSTNNIDIIKALEGRKMTAATACSTRCLDRSGHASGAADDLSRAQRNPKPADKTDLFEILSWTTPEAARGRPPRSTKLQAEALRRQVPDVRDSKHGRARQPPPMKCRTVVDLLPHLVNGLTLGLLFALIALGFMLIVGVMELINLAHGSLFALGAYFALRDRITALPLPPTASGLWRQCRSAGATRWRCCWRHSSALAGMVLELCLRRTYGKDPL